MATDAGAEVVRGEETAQNIRCAPCTQAPARRLRRSAFAEQVVEIRERCVQRARARAPVAEPG